MLRGLQVNRWFGSLTEVQRMKIGIRTSREWNSLTMDERYKLMHSHQNIGVITTTCMAIYPKSVNDNKASGEYAMKTKGKPWSPSDIKDLMYLRGEGHSYLTIGNMLGRTRHACQHRYNVEKQKLKQAL